MVSSLSRRTNCPGRSSFLDPFDAKLGSHVRGLPFNELVFEPSSQTFATTYSEMSVACESRSRAPARPNCPFGKGLAKHARVRSGGRQQYAQIESCAKCHARRGFVHPGHHAGSSFLDHFLPEVVQPWAGHLPTYTGRLTMRFRVSAPMFRARCSTRASNASIAMTRIPFGSTALCMRCHSPTPENPTFYDSPAHHFHQPGSKGAQCVECHMPEKTYMGIDARRDHSIRIPRPDLSVKFGMPNACNRCHEDKDAQWAADAIVARKGPGRPKEVRHPEAFHAFRSGKPNASSKQPVTRRLRPLLGRELCLLSGDF